MIDQTEAALGTVGIEATRPSVPGFLGDEAEDAYNVVGSGEAWEVHRDLLEKHGELYNPTVKALIERGAGWTDARRRRAEETRARVGEYLDELFATHDYVVLPATVVPSPTFAQADASFRSRTLRLNAPASLAGLPALTVPIHFDAVRSGGIQVVVPRGGEYRLKRFLETWRRTHSS